MNDARFTHRQASLVCDPDLPGTTPSHPLSLPGAPCLTTCWNMILFSSVVHDLDWTFDPLREGEAGDMMVDSLLSSSE